MMAFSPQTKSKRWPERTLYERIVEKIVLDEQTGCWNFQGSTQSKLRYGSIWIGGGKQMATHRAMWTALHGRPARHEFVCHKCDNPKCCNPEHLFLGSLADNNRDMASKGRYNHQQRTHCIHGHEFTPENIYRSPSRPDKRQCRACEVERRGLTREQRLVRKVYDGSVRKRDRKKLYRETGRTS